MVLILFHSITVLAMISKSQNMNTLTEVIIIIIIIIICLESAQKNEKRKNEQTNRECELTAGSIRSCLLIMKLRNFPVNLQNISQRKKTLTVNFFFIQFQNEN